MIEHMCLLVNQILYYVLPFCVYSSLNVGNNKQYDFYMFCYVVVGTFLQTDHILLFMYTDVFMRPKVCPVGI